MRGYFLFSFLFVNMGLVNKIQESQMLIFHPVMS